MSCGLAAPLVVGGSPRVQLVNHLFDQLSWNVAHPYAVMDK